MRVAVVGGGIIGLASAWRLARAGASVTLFDAAPEAREASWAAAGMLAPHHEYDGDSPLWRLCVASLERWPGFISDLGVDAQRVDFASADGLIPLLDADDEHAAASKQQFLASVGVNCRRLDGPALRAAEPALSAIVRSALLIPAARMNPRLVIALLRERCAKIGVRLRYADAVSRLEGSTLHTASGHESFDHVVLASGAWTVALATLAGLQLRGEPVKGQLLRFASDDDVLAHFIHSRHTYLVPRSGQGLVVGSTMIQSGFDKTEDPAAIASLAEAARRLLPALKAAAIVETWTGLRPRLAHGLPVLATVRPGLTVATGHFRNGILLTPISAEIVTALVLNRKPPVDPAAFAIP